LPENYQSSKNYIIMWEALIGAGASVAGGILGGRAAAKAARKKAALLDKMDRENQSWYDRRMNEDYTQTAEAVNAMRMMRENADRSVKRSEGVAAVMGGTDESVAQAKAAANEAVGNTLANIAAQGTAQKNAVESQYLSQKNNINSQRLGAYDAQAAAAAQAGGAAMQAGMGLVQDSVMRNMFKDSGEKKKDNNGGKP
jgi:hypothetical protein